MVDKQKLIDTRDYISDSLNAYVVYDNDYTSFGQVMSYYGADLISMINEMIEGLPNETNNAERTEKVNE